jgi:hypothetical protein
MTMASDKSPREISKRRSRAFWIAMCLLGVIFGVLGGQMNWSQDVAFVVLAIAGTVAGTLTLHTSLFDELRPPRRGATRTRARG